MTLLLHYYYTYHFYKSMTFITHNDKISENTIITLMTVLFIAIVTFHIYYDTFGYQYTIFSIIAFRTIITLIALTYY
jgi:hypothetical protein